MVINRIGKQVARTYINPYHIYNKVCDSDCLEMTKGVRFKGELPEVLANKYAIFFFLFSLI